MVRVFRAAMLTCLMVLMSGPAGAWSQGGHMTIAAAAWPQLKPKIQTRVGELLKLNPRYGSWTKNVNEAKKAQVAFVLASVWADDIKFDAIYINDGEDAEVPNADRNIGYADILTHRYWHYIDIPFSTDGTSLIQPPSPNAQTRILDFRRTLRYPLASDDVKSYDLVWLIHLVGDIHQPLHATGRFSADLEEGDRGGNEIKVTGCVCGADNLHSLWDGLLGKGITVDEAVAAAALLPAPDPVASSKTRPETWVRESFELAKRDVYAAPIGEGAGPFPMTDEYFNRAMADAKSQAALGATRLANLINDALR